MKHLRHILSVGMLIALVASASAQSWLTNGLVAYYPFNGNANDESGNGNDGVPQYLSYGNNRFGKTNGAGLFGYTSGVSSYFYFGNNSQVLCPTLNTLPNYPLTFTFWMNLTAYQTWLSFRGGGIMTIIGKEGSGYQDAAVSIYSDNGIATNQMAYLGSVWNNGGFSPRLKQWYHVSFSLTTNATQTFYVDGALVSQIVSPTILNCSTDIPFKIGDSSPYGSPNGYRVPFDGYISDVRIYNRALSSNEVAQLYAIESSNICTPHKATATPVLVNGFVVGATITESGCGYTNAPLVLIQGGGGAGSTATATVNNGQVTGINITSAGSGYSTTPAPKIVIASPPFEPSVGIAVSRVNVTQHVTLGRNYVLKSSADLATWSATGQAFTAVSENYTNEFVVGQTGQFFRLREVP